MKTFLKHFVVFGLGTLILAGGSAFGETLQDDVRHMLTTNPELQKKVYERLAKDQVIVQKESGYYPKIDAYLGAGFTERHEPEHYKVWPKETILSLRQNIFRFYGTTYDVARVKAEANAAAYELQADSEDIALEVCKVYLGVLEKLELHELAKENLTIHQQIQDQMKLRSRSGVDRKADLDQVMGRVAKAEYEIVKTLQGLIDAKTEYQKVLGRLPVNLLKPDPVDVPLPPSMEEAVEEALLKRPRVKAAKADLEAHEFQYRAAKSFYYPTLDLAVDYSWEDDVDEPGLVEEFRAVGSISFNIFKGLADQGRVRETKHLIRWANEIYKNTKRETVQSIRLSYEDYTSAKDKITHLEDYVRSTELTAEAFGKQWMIGRRTMFDVLDTQAEYINAKIDLTKDLYKKMYAVYRILNGTGKLVHSLDLQWPVESRVIETKSSVPGYAPAAAPAAAAAASGKPAPAKEAPTFQEKFYDSINKPRSETKTTVETKAVAETKTVEPKTTMAEAPKTSAPEPAKKESSFMDVFYKSINTSKK